MRQRWPRILTLLGLFIGLGVVWCLWPTSHQLYVVDVRGLTTIVRVSEGSVEARSGTRLQPSDRVTTARDGEAVLQYGENTQIRLGPRSSVEVARVDDDGVSLEVEGGTVRAIVRPDAGQVRVGNQGRGVVARDATVDVGVRDDVLDVRAIEGDVELEGVDRERLSEGERAVIAERTARVGTVPSSLLLLVDEAPRRTAKVEHMVRGRTAPGADVVIRGPLATVRIRADAEGNFEVPVALTEGDNAVTVEAVDVFGQTTTTEVELPVLDTRAPLVGIGVEYPK